MKRPRYILCRWPHGWSIEPGTPGIGGIPLNAMAEALAEIGHRIPEAAMCPGIAHHLRMLGRKETAAVAGFPTALEAWRKEIASELAQTWPDPQESWIRGTDTGRSSMAVFAALAGKPHLQDAALRETAGETPRDQADLGRCLRLLEKIPAWKTRIAEVGVFWEKRGKPAWKKLAQNWAKLEKASGEKETSEILADAGQNR